MDPHGDGSEDPQGTRGVGYRETQDRDHVQLWRLVGRISVVHIPLVRPERTLWGRNNTICIRNRQCELSVRAAVHMKF